MGFLSFKFLLLSGNSQSRSPEKNHIGVFVDVYESGSHDVSFGLKDPGALSPEYSNGDDLIAHDADVISIWRLQGAVIDLSSLYDDVVGIFLFNSARRFPWNREEQYYHHKAQQNMPSRYPIL
jgi:hypothetical protein